MERQTRSQRRLRRRRRRTAAIGVLAVLVLVGVVFVSCLGGSSTTSTTTTKPSSGTNKPGHSTEPPSIEAGVEPWQLQAPLSREAGVANGAGLTVLGGITPAGSSVAGVYTLDPATGAHSAAGTLPDAVHDGRSEEPTSEIQSR